MVKPPPYALPSIEGVHKGTTVVLLLSKDDLSMEVSLSDTVVVGPAVVVDGVETMLRISV